MSRLILALVAVLAFCSCGDDVVTNVVVDPSPSPPPDHDALCEIRDSFIYVTRGDRIVFSWGLGQVVMAHVRPIYAGEADPQFDVDKCTGFDRVRWYTVGGDPVFFVGDQSAPDVGVLVSQPGFWCFRAQPLSLTEPSEFCANVLPPE